MIVDFCSTNLRLLESAKALHDTATDQLRPGDRVRVLRCITRCHTCGYTPNVRIDFQTFDDVSPLTLKNLLAQEGRFHDVSE
ncbi:MULTISPECIES: hypothetical protein [Pelagibacterium]|uniref:hypothetical protein n=1 Tax=Pelagibacterium TaxID=1082930 RepID=UPI002FC7761E